MAETEGSNQWLCDALLAAKGEQKGDGCGSGHAKPLPQGQGQAGIGNPRKQVRDVLWAEGMSPPLPQPLSQQTFLLFREGCRGELPGGHGRGGGGQQHESAGTELC